MTSGTSNTYQVSFANTSPYDIDVNASYTAGPPALAEVTVLPGTGVEWVGSGQYPDALPFGALVDGADTFSSDPVGFLVEEPDALGNFSATDDSAYLGAEFLIDGSTYYGYIHLATAATTTGPSASFTVEDWAYESDAGVGIAAGAGESPEPSTLALLALGAAVLAAFRHKQPRQ